MRKYIVVIVSCVLICLLIIGFSIPDRIRYSIDGMGAFDTKYSKRKEALSIQELELDFSVYDKEPITIYKWNDNIKLVLENITYKGDSYRFEIVSIGDSTFEGGAIIQFDTVEDSYIDIEDGEQLVFQYMGCEDIENDTIKYYFELYPWDESFDVKKFASLKIAVPIKSADLVTYERK